MERDLEYENNNIGFYYQYPEEDGGGIKCKKYDNDTYLHKCPLCRT